jgi:hypothetical protein
MPSLYISESDIPDLEEEEAMLEAIRASIAKKRAEKEARSFSGDGNETGDGPTK